jgi:protease-4
MDSNLPPPISPNPPPLIPSRPLPRPRKSTGWIIALVIVGVILVMAVVASLFLPHFFQISGGVGGRQLQEATLEFNGSRNKIAVIPVEGIISSDMFDSGGYGMVEFIQDQFKTAARDSRVKAVVLKVDSPGGEVLASDDIYHAIQDFQKDSGKPVVVSMGSVAASGGYYVSAPCRWIVANELTITGSIGVIFHSFNYRGLMDKVGLRPVVYKSGKYKDMLSGDRREEDVPPEEKEMLKKLIDETFEKFKSIVVEGRQWANKHNKSNPDDKGRALKGNWTDYADGRVLSGKEAYDLGFVDELGNLETAVDRAQKLAGIEDANLVQYHQLFDLSNLFHLFGKSDAHGIKVDLGLDLPRLKSGRLYFLAPTFVH